MSAYPAARYAVVNGVLVDEIIYGPAEERPGWEPTPHKFRELTADELRLSGVPPEDIPAAVRREKIRVALIFAGRSIEEAEEIAAREPLEDPAAPPINQADLKARVRELESLVESKDAEIADMTERFDRNWKQLIAERDSLKEQLQEAQSPKKRGPKAKPEAAPAQADPTHAAEQN